MPTVGLETKISAGERPQTNTVDREATATGLGDLEKINNLLLLVIEPKA